MHIIKEAWQTDSNQRTNNERNWRKQGIKNATIKRYQRLLADQGGKCALCKCLPTSERLALDHNHSTGEVRGLLCRRCNFLVGIIENFPAEIESGIAGVQAYATSQATLTESDKKSMGLRPYVEDRKTYIVRDLVTFQNANPLMPMSDVIRYIALKFKKSPITIKRYIGLA